MVLLTAVCFLLTCLLVHADEDRCSALDDCLAPSKKFDFRFEYKSLNLTIIEKIVDEYCQLAPTVHKCVIDYKDSCNDIDALIIDAHIAHTCTDEGRQEIVKIARSDCITDELRRKQFFGQRENCTFNNFVDYDKAKFSSWNEWVCNILQINSYCLKTITLKECEAELAQYLDKVNSLNIKTRNCGKNVSTTLTPNNNS